MKSKLHALLDKKGYLVFDGAMGTMLLNYGYSGNCPEKLNLDDPELIKKIHLEYILAGADIIEANTFGASPIKLAQFGLADQTEKINMAGVAIARAAAFKDTLVAGDIGPLGKLLEPVGETTFDEAYDAFAQQAKALARGGADLLIIETMSDIQEMRAALIAAKQETNLPVICSFTLSENGRTMTGTDFITAGLTCAALGADVISTNCGNGPEQLYALLKGLKKDLQKIHIPLMIMPNAGLPTLLDGKAVYTMLPEEFGKKTAACSELGFQFFGGCCGTSPAHIKQLRLALEKQEKCASKPKASEKAIYFTSRGAYVELGKKSPLLKIGERLNPTARKAFAEDIRNDRTAFLKQEAAAQTAEGAALLDLNVGVPEIDQKVVMKKMISTLINSCQTPLCLDSDDPAVLEIALKNYPGIALINSVNGKAHSMQNILPLAKKYGAAVIALALDEKGIPNTAAGRMKIVKKIVAKAKPYGLSAARIFVDTLVMAVATDGAAPQVTIETIKACTSIGLKTSLGVSNVSFGLPKRAVINNAFLTLAVKAGLTAAIINTASFKQYAKSDAEFKLAEAVLTGKDKDAKLYIAAMKRDSGVAVAKLTSTHSKRTIEESIYQAIVQGEEDAILGYSEEALSTLPPQQILDILIRAIEHVGALYQNGEYFLPQMVQSANTMKKAFQRVKKNIPVGESTSAGTVVICTVQGDIHDIGKNIVAMMLENHGFRVIDLGKDVPAAEVVRAAKKEKADIVCLSALLTTTMLEMADVKKALDKAGVNVQLMVGGAVVTAGYAARISANYSKDAVGAVQKAKELMNEKK